MTGPSEIFVHDTLVVIDTGHLAVRVQGKLTVINECEDSKNLAGITVRLPELGLTTHTDDSGRYQFARVPLKPTVVVYLRSDLHRAIDTATPEPDSADNFNFYAAPLYTHQNHSARIEGEPEFFRSKKPIFRDTTLIGSDGLERKTQVVIDSAWDGFAQFTVWGIDNYNNEWTHSVIYFLVSRDPNIDPSDPSTYFLVQGREFTFEQKVQMYRGQLAVYGIQAFEPIYVAATSASACDLQNFRRPQRPSPGMRMSKVIRMNAP
jgi:hypothetical protein